MSARTVGWVDGRPKLVPPLSNGPEGMEPQAAARPSDKARWWLATASKVTCIEWSKSSVTVYEAGPHSDSKF